VRPSVTAIAAEREEEENYDDDDDEDDDDAAWLLDRSLLLEWQHCFDVAP